MATCIAANRATVKVDNIKDASSKAATEINQLTSDLRRSLDPISAKMCQWAAPQYDASGEGADRSAYIAAQVALSAATIALYTYIQNKQYDIARQYRNISKDKWTRFRDKYAPLEQKMLNEASGTGEPTTDYADAFSRGNTAVTSTFSLANASMSNYAKAYALCMDPTLGLDLLKGRALDDTINYNYRDAENYNYYLSDKRWNRRSDILNLGRHNSATAFSYATNASKALGGVASAIASASNGISGFLGYLFNRNDTVYPSQFSMAAPFGTGAIMASGQPANV